MKRIAPAAVAACLAMTGLATATAAQHESNPQSSRPDPCLHHRHPGAEQKRLAGHVLSYAHWRHPKVGPGAVATMRRLRGCAPARRRDAMARAWEAAKTDLALQHRYREVATEPGFDGEGRFLRWLPIPSYVVECETRGSHGEERWTATNPTSGANGPGQMTPEHGQPISPQTAIERVVYWEAVAELWAGGSGAGNWACA